MGVIALAFFLHAVLVQQMAFESKPKRKMVITHREDEKKTNSSHKININIDTIGIETDTNTNTCGPSNQVLFKTEEVATAPILPKSMKLSKACRKLAANSILKKSKTTQASNFRLVW